jgi:hypothetical protein
MDLEAGTERGGVEGIVRRREREGGREQRPADARKLSARCHGSWYVIAEVGDCAQGRKNVQLKAKNTHRAVVPLLHQPVARSVKRVLTGCIVQRLDPAVVATSSTSSRNSVLSSSPRPTDAAEKREARQNIIKTPATQMNQSDDSNVNARNGSRLCLRLRVCIAQGHDVPILERGHGLNRWRCRREQPSGQQPMSHRVPAAASTALCLASLFLASPPPSQSYMQSAITLPP